MRPLLCTLILWLSTLSAHAGYFELGLSGNFRKTYLPSNSVEEAFDQSQSLTGSVAYYFYEMAAVELNYTKVNSKRFVPSSVANVTTTHFFCLIGTDFIFTFAERKASFVPYVKFGIGYFIEKEVAFAYDDGIGVPDTVVVGLEKTLVPSAGFGVRMRLTDRLAVKLGMELWSSDALSNDPKVDWAGKAGISWFL